MVRTRNASRVRRRARPNRSRLAIRKLNQGLNLHPVVCRLPADPPAVLNSWERAVSLPIRMVCSTGISSQSVHSTFATPSTLTVIWDSTFKTPHYAVLTVADLWSCLRTYSGLDTALKSPNVDIAICKVMVWGASEQTAGTSTTMKLMVDMGGISSGFTASDTSTPMNRPRAGCSIPIRYWHASDSPTPVIHIYPSAQASITGMVPWKLTASPVDIGWVQVSCIIRLHSSSA